MLRINQRFSSIRALCDRVRNGNHQFNGDRIEIGAVLVCGACFAVKNYWYQSAVFGEDSRFLSSLIHGHILDSKFLVGVIFFALIAAIVKGLSAKIAKVVLGFVSCWYLADCISLIDYSTPLSPGYILWALSDFESNWNELRLERIFAIVAALMLLVRCPRPAGRLGFVALLGVAVFLMSGWSSAQMNQYSFETRLTALSGEFSGSGKRTAGVEIDIFGPGGKGKALEKEVPIAKTKRPIVLIILESVSAWDLKSIAPDGSGYMPNLDRISSDGVLFTNFYANTSWSGGAYLSTFAGTPLLRFPGASKSPTKAFKRHGTMLDELLAHDYRAEMVLGVPLKTYDLDRLFKRFRFHNSHFPPPLPGLEHAKTAFGGVEDRSIYRFVLNRIDGLKAEGNTFFISAITMSTHEPFTSPLDPKGSVPAAFDYADRAFAEFYESLRQRNFFDEGILVVMGDHHRRIPVGTEERKELGCSAHMRVPLLVFGKGFSPGIDERLFQQADLLRKLHAIPDPSAKLSSRVYFSDWHATAHAEWSKAEVVSKIGENAVCGSLSISDKTIAVENLSESETLPVLAEARSYLLQSVDLKRKNKSAKEKPEQRRM